ncbi:MAG: hypothetical protein QF632_04455 [Candidatus Woesearchaeota archaeon]|jgi:hypothetical protein|nr:hypothetical protein [Candidatus Woesearchaeota archaeon]
MSIIEEAEECLDQGLNDIRNSRYGQLKYIGIESLSVLVGAAVGSVARMTGIPQVIVIPFIPDSCGMISVGSRKLMQRYLSERAKYLIGAAMTYSDVIYEFGRELLG